MGDSMILSGADNRGETAVSDEAPAFRLTREQLSSYEENGFIAIESLLDDSDLLPLEDEYDCLLDDLAQRLHCQGKIPSAFDGLSFGERFARVLEYEPDLHRHFNISLPLINGPVDPESYRMHSGPAVFGLLRNRKILDVVECILGPEISYEPYVYRKDAGRSFLPHFPSGTWTLEARWGSSSHTEVVTVREGERNVIDLTGMVSP